MYKLPVIYIFCALAFVKTHPVEDAEIDNNEIEQEYVPEGPGADISYLGKSVFGKPSDESGVKIADWNENSGVNPEEMGEYAEGDILFTGDARNGLIAETSRWPGAIVPYEIKGPYTPEDMKTIEKAMGEFHKNTCIRFRLRQRTDNDYIEIINTKTGCWSSVGKVGGSQQVNLQSPGCTGTIGTPVHELMHALGCGHEQNRYERDDYVNIVWSNIQSGKDNNFKKSSKETTSGFGVPYDFGSVMHYSDKSFSINGQPTIVAKSNGATMGQRSGFSRGDIKKLNNMYCKNIDRNNNDVGGGSGLLSFLFG